MKKQLESLAKYKHHLFIIVALLAANYVLMPMAQWQEEQVQTLNLLKKQQAKVVNLVSSKDTLQSKLADIENNFVQAKGYLFTEEKEAIFKLNAQSAVESVLLNAGCNIERIGFKGDTAVSSALTRWTMELRFKGDSVCLTKTTRGLETLKPTVQIVDHNFNHRSLNMEGEGHFNAQITTNTWHYREAND